VFAFAEDDQSYRPLFAYAGEGSYARRKILLLMEPARAQYDRPFVGDERG
jgi:hypothetical protein